jgi:hypothetical protein
MKIKDNSIILMEKKMKQVVVNRIIIYKNLIILLKMKLIKKIPQIYFHQIIMKSLNKSIKSLSIKPIPFQ